VLAISQQTLGAALGLTFQQVLKYGGHQSHWGEPAASDF
jgi:hypothetical protein